MFSILHWKTVTFVWTVTIRSNTSKSKSILLKYPLEHDCEVGFLCFSEICILYGYLLPNLFKQCRVFFQLDDDEKYNDPLNFLYNSKYDLPTIYIKHLLIGSSNASIWFKGYILI